MIVPPGATSVSVDVFFADDTGAAVTGKVAADFPACKWSGGSNTADTTITLTDLAAITTAHPNDNTAGGVKEREGGWYRLDLPNNMLTSAGRKTLTFAETTNKRIVAPFVDCQYAQADVRQLLGTAWLTPAVPGTPDMNAKQIGGQTAPLDANNLLKVDVEDWKGATAPANTGDAYAVVNDSTFGNSKLVRSTTPANTFDVSPTGEGGLDFNNIKDATGARTLTNIRVPNVTLCDTCTTNTDMRGTDNAALASVWTSTRGSYVDNLSSGAVALAATALSTATWTGARAGYLDNLNVGGAVASHADTVAINQSASKHMLLVTVGQYEPGETYTIEMRTFAAADGSAVNADSTPTLTATGNVSGNLSGNLSAATNPETGVYRWTYTPGATPTLEQIRMGGSATISSATFTLSAYTQTVDEATAVFTAADQSHLTSIFNKLPANNIADETLVLAAVGSPMQAYTQPTGFLAATFPTGTIANTTNITAGTISTVTNVTNAPTVGDLTAAMKLSVQTAADAAITANALVLEIEADTDTLTAGVTVTTNNDKTGYALSAAGLDSISAAEPSAKPTTFASWLMWVVQRFRRSTLTATQLKTLTEAGATVTTQTVSDDGTTQSLGAPS